jgi:hypothetical protein
MPNRYDNYTAGMGSENCLNKMNAQMNSEIGHDHSTNPGNGKSSIPGSAINGAVASATNVTTNINGNAITSIFETDGVTVKNATNVTTNINGNAITSIFEVDGVTVKNATDSLKIGGHSYELIREGSVNLNAGTVSPGIDLEYIFYNSYHSYIVFLKRKGDLGSVTFGPWWTIVPGRLSVPPAYNDRDQLFIKNQDSNPHIFDYKVYALRGTSMWS